MKDYVIITDAACDLTTQTREAYGIKIIPVKLSFVDNKDRVFSCRLSNSDWDNTEFSAFYDAMRRGTKILTSPISPEEYEQVFEGWLEQGKNVLYLACSSALSGTFNSSLVAKDRIDKKYGKGRVICIDTLSAHTSLGLICIEASSMKSKGKSMNTVAKWVERHKNEANLVYTADSLKYVQRAGRVSMSKAVLGGLLMFKPVVIMDIRGRNYANAKVRGKKKSLRYIEEYCKERIDLESGGRVFVGHADEYETAQMVAEELKEWLEEHKIEVEIVRMGPCIGASAGPGTVSIAFWGKGR